MANTVIFGKNKNIVSVKEAFLAAKKAAKEKARKVHEDRVAKAAAEELYVQLRKYSDLLGMEASETWLHEVEAEIESLCRKIDPSEIHEEMLPLMEGVTNTYFVVHHSCGHNKIRSYYNNEELLYVRKTKENTFYVHVKSDVECEDCTGGCFDKPDSLLQAAIYSHGLAAYQGKRSVSDILWDAANIDSHPEWEICCAWKTQHIGPVGIYVRGNVTVASNIDLCSSVSDSGDRVFDTEDWRSRGIFWRREDLDFSQWDHCEFMVQTDEIVGFWIKDWYLASSEGQQIKAVVEKIGRRLFVVKKRH